MPLLEGEREAKSSAGVASSPARRQGQLSDMAKNVIRSSATSSSASDDIPFCDADTHKPPTSVAPPKIPVSRTQAQKETKPPTSQQFLNPSNGIGHALNDTPLSTAPGSPQM